MRLLASKFMKWFISFISQSDLKSKFFSAFQILLYTDAMEISTFYTTFNHSQLTRQQNSPKNQIPYARHYKPLLIRNRSWILTIHKARILRKKGPWKTIFGLQVSKKYTNPGLQWRAYDVMSFVERSVKWQNFHCQIV